MALQARAVVDRKDLKEALEKIPEQVPGAVGTALSYPARKLHEAITGKKIEQQYAKGGSVKNPFAKGGSPNYGKDYSKRSK